MKDTSLCFAGKNTGVTHVFGGWWAKLHSSTHSAYACEKMYDIRIHTLAVGDQ